jgi:hypothetical protein
VLKSKTYVVCWDEVLDNTIKIESELVAGEFDYQIINKSRLRTEDLRWVKAKDTRYYGHFYMALEDFMSSTPHSIFIFNAGDSRWPEISNYTKRLEQLFSDNPNTGVISPNQTNDPFTGSGSFVAASESIRGLDLSTLTNGIFVALSRDIAEITYEYMTWAFSNQVYFYSMTSGWGLDYAYCAASTYMNKYVYKDTTVTMHHPTGSGYNYWVAENEWHMITKSFVKFWKEKDYDSVMIENLFKLYIQKVDGKDKFNLKAEELYLNAKSDLAF